MHLGKYFLCNFCGIIISIYRVIKRFNVQKIEKKKFTEIYNEAKLKTKRKLSRIFLFVSTFDISAFSV